MHPPLSGVALLALCCGALVDHALLHDRAVHGEAVGCRLGGIFGGGCGDEGFQDGVLGCVGFCSWLWWIGGGGDGAYDNCRVPRAHLGVFVFRDVPQGGVAGLGCC